MGELVLTYDIGTTGNKCTIFDTAGETLASVTVAYGTEYPRPGWSQQNAEDYWDSVVRGTRELVRVAPELAADVCGIGLSGHMNGMLPVDGGGNALFPEIIHSDNRSASLCNGIRKEIGDDEFFGITGNRIDSHLSLPKMLWFRDNHRSLYEKTAWFLQSKDYIAGRLTGKFGKTDFSDASLTCVLDLRKKKWSSRILKACSLDGDKMPELLSSHDRVGELSSEAAGLLGLVQGIPVFAGGGDASCSARGAGVSDYFTAQNYIGSSSWISVLSAEPLMDSRRRIQNFYDIDGKSMNVCGTVQSAGIALDWMMKELAAGGDELPSYRSVEALAGRVPPGSSGIFFIPYMMGERTPHWNPSLKGGFVGLSLIHTREDMIRAVFEGVALALRDVLEVFKENGLCVEELALSGGGALSPFWNRMMSSIYGRPVKISSSPKQATSLGAAMAAAVGAGLFPDYKSAASLVQFDRNYEPDPDHSPVYEHVFREYQSLYEPYAVLSGELTRYQNTFFEGEKNEP